MDPLTEITSEDESVDDVAKRKSQDNIGAAEERAASSYAWEYFKYHAQQRQSVFRFYLLIVGASLAGYATHGEGRTSILYGVLLIIMSFLFYRLDKRSYKLVKVAEDYLKEDEERLSNKIGSPYIKMVSIADSKKSKAWPNRYFQTFRQIYQIMFWFFGLLGLYISVEWTGVSIAKGLSPLRQYICG